MRLEQLLFGLVVIIGIGLGCEIAGVFDKEPVIGYSVKEVALMMKIKDLNNEIDELNNENKIIEKDNERIIKNIDADSAIIYNSSRSYRDSLRSELFR